MKRFISSITFITAFIISSNNLFSMQKNNLYVENHYGAPIKYKIGLSKSNAPEINVNNLDRSLIGTISEINDLSIRTTGKGSSLFSYFTELTDTLQQVKTES